MLLYNVKLQTKVSIIVLSVHAPSEDKSNDVKDSFCEELGCECYQFPRYAMKILFGNFNVKVNREDIFKATVRKESSHEIRNDNGVRVVNFAISRKLVVKSTMLPHHNIYKYMVVAKVGERLAVSK
jgi:hypothetical protein